MKTRLSPAFLVLALGLGGWFLPSPASAAITFVNPASKDLNSTSSTIQISMPTNTVKDDVMVAGIAFRPNTITMSVVPSGWTLVRRVTTTASTAEGLEVYYKVAGTGEAGPYTWTLSTTASNAGGIQSFRGVETTNPYTVEAGTTSASSMNFPAPSVTTNVANTMIVTHHALGSAERFTPPSGFTPAFTEAFDVASRATSNAAGESIEGNYWPAGSIGTYGVSPLFQATVGANGDTGVMHTLVLNPACPTVTELDYVAATTQSGSVTLYWSPSTTVLILRKPTNVFVADEKPTQVKPYAVNDLIGAANTAKVVYNGVAATSWQDTGVSAGTVYYYKVFAKTSTPCYAQGTVNPTNGVSATTTPSGAQPSWSYTIPGGVILKAGIAGTGALYTSNNSNQIVALQTADGTQSWAPISTGNQSVQAWLTWIPWSGSSTNAIIAGDLGGKVYSWNPATGATSWTPFVPSGATAIQATAAVQLSNYSTCCNFQNTYGTNVDVIFVATRNSNTSNKLFPIRADTGSQAAPFNWTFTGDANGLGDIVGTPYVDYKQDRIYVAANNNAGGSPRSLWVINSLNGSSIACASTAVCGLGNLQISPTLSYDGTTIYVVTTGGDLYAIDARTLDFKWTGTHKVALGATSTLNEFIWEDYTTPFRLYFSTADGGGVGSVWCLQDQLVAQGSQVAPPTLPTAPPYGACPWKSNNGSTNTTIGGVSAPLLLNRLFVGANDGKLHQINLTTGVDEKTFCLEASCPAKTLGDVSTEDGTQLYVATTEPKLYRVNLNGSGLLPP